MPISTVKILKYVQQCYVLSGFELYPRWVPLIYSTCIQMLLKLIHLSLKVAL